MHALRHLLHGPAARRCPLLGSPDTTAQSERQKPASAVAVRDLLAHSPSRSLAEIGGYDVIGRERQHWWDPKTGMLRTGA